MTMTDELTDDLHDLELADQEAAVRVEDDAT